MSELVGQRNKNPLHYEIRLGAPDTLEGRADMARMLRIHGRAMIAMAEELEGNVEKGLHIHMAGGPPE